MAFIDGTIVNALCLRYGVWIFRLPSIQLGISPISFRN
jgi:hypothetical protein